MTFSTSIINDVWVFQNVFSVALGVSNLVIITFFLTKIYFSVTGYKVNTGY